MDFWVKQVVQTNLSFPILSWSVKLVHRLSAGKFVFSLKTSIVTITGIGIVDSGVIRFNSTPIYFFCSNEFNFKGK